MADRTAEPDRQRPATVSALDSRPAPAATKPDPVATKPATGANPRTEPAATDAPALDPGKAAKGLIVTIVIAIVAVAALVWIFKKL